MEDVIEPLISIKNKMMGGTILVDSSIKIYDAIF